MTAYFSRLVTRRPVGSQTHSPNRHQTRRLGGPVRLLLGVAGLALLAGCASEPETRPCPRAVVLKDASRQVKFNGAGRDLTDVLFEAQIQTGALSCEYDENVLDIDLPVTVTASRGPANSDRLANIRYFVAIAQTNETVLARESFDITIPFPGNRTRVAGQEGIGQVITLPAGQDGGDYRIYVGLELTHDELDYNRANY
ncbi:MAG: hypothetical protein ACFB13_19685 [Kiloniellaceae bacterium]